jgi:hypothetical protein
MIFHLKIGSVVAIAVFNNGTNNNATWIYYIVYDVFLRVIGERIWICTRFAVRTDSTARYREITFIALPIRRYSHIDIA